MISRQSRINPHTRGFPALCEGGAFYLPLTQGQRARIDSSSTFLAAWKWSCFLDPATKTFYAKRTIPTPGGKRSLFLHQAVLGMPLNRSLKIDHINGDSLDNRRENLRFATNRLNSWNSNRRRKGLTTSKYVGVYWSAKARKWISHIRERGVYRYLGSFTSEESASLAYQAALAEIEQIISPYPAGFPERSTHV